MSYTRKCFQRSKRGNPNQISPIPFIISTLCIQWKVLVIENLEQIFRASKLTSSTNPHSAPFAIHSTINSLHFASAFVKYLCKSSKFNSPSWEQLNPTRTFIMKRQAKISHRNTWSGLDYEVYRCHSVWWKRRFKTKNRFPQIKDLLLRFQHVSLFCPLRDWGVCLIESLFSILFSETFSIIKWIFQFGFHRTFAFSSEISVCGRNSVWKVFLWSVDGISHYWNGGGFFLILFRSIQFGKLAHAWTKIISS